MMRKFMNNSVFVLLPDTLPCTVNFLKYLNVSSSLTKCQHFKICHLNKGKKHFACFVCLSAFLSNARVPELNTHARAAKLICATIVACTLSAHTLNHNQHNTTTITSTKVENENLHLFFIKTKWKE